MKKSTLLLLGIFFHLISSLVFSRQLPGMLKQIDIDANVLCGVNSADEIFCADENLESSPNWFRLPGALSHISVSKGRLMGVNSIGQIYFADNYKDAKWLLLQGQLRQIDFDDKVICGVNSADQIYCADQGYDTLSATPNWVQIPGALSQVSVSQGRLMGVNYVGHVYFAENYKDVNWVLLPDRFLKQVNIDGNMICGVDSVDQVFCAYKNIGKNPNWFEVNGSLKYASVSNQRLFGVSALDFIYFTRTTDVKLVSHAFPAADWEFAYGNFNGLVPTNGEAIALLKKTSDYSTVISELDYVLENPTDSYNYTGLVSRYSTGNAYRAYVARQPNETTAVLYIDSLKNHAWSYLNTLNGIQTSGTIRLENVGSKLTVFINGILVLTANDASLSKGSVGFIVSAGPSAKFSNFKSNAMSVPDSLTPTQLTAKIAELSAKVEEVQSRLVSGQTPEQIIQGVLNRNADAKNSASTNSVNSAQIKAVFDDAARSLNSSLSHSQNVNTWYSDFTGRVVQEKQTSQAALTNYKQQTAANFTTASQSANSRLNSNQSSANAQLATINQLNVVISSQPPMAVLASTVTSLEDSIRNITNIKDDLTGLNSDFSATIGIFEGTTATLYRTTEAIQLSAAGILSNANSLRVYHSDLLKTVSGFESSNQTINQIWYQLTLTINQLNSINSGINASAAQLDSAAASITTEANSIAASLVESRNNAAAFRGIHNSNQMEIDSLYQGIDILSQLILSIPDPAERALAQATLEKMRLSVDKLNSNQSEFIIQINRYDSLTLSKQNAVNTILARVTQIQATANQLRALSIEQSNIIAAQWGLAHSLTQVAINQNDLINQQKSILSAQLVIISQFDALGAEVNSIALQQISALSLQQGAIATQKQLVANSLALLQQLAAEIAKQNQIVATQKLLLIPKCASFTATPTTVTQGDNFALTLIPGGYVTRVVIDGTDKNILGDTISVVADASRTYTAFVVGPQTLQYPQGQQVNCASVAVTVVPSEFVSLRTPQDLEKMRVNPNGKFRMENDIDMSGQPEWEGILAFTGALDGQGFGIKGLKLKATINKAKDQSSTCINPWLNLKAGLFINAVYADLHNFSIDATYKVIPKGSLGTCKDNYSTIEITPENFPVSVSALAFNIVHDPTSSKSKLHDIRTSLLLEYAPPQSHNHIKSVSVYGLGNIIFSPIDRWASAFDFGPKGVLERVISNITFGGIPMPTPYMGRKDEPFPTVPNPINYVALKNLIAEVKVTGVLDLVPYNSSYDPVEVFGGRLIIGGFNSNSPNARPTFSLENIKTKVELFGDVAYSSLHILLDHRPTSSLINIPQYRVPKVVLNGGEHILKRGSDVNLARGAVIESRSLANYSTMSDFITFCQAWSIPNDVENYSSSVSIKKYKVNLSSTDLNSYIDTSSTIGLYDSNSYFRIVAYAGTYMSVDAEDVELKQNDYRFGISTVLSGSSEPTSIYHGKGGTLTLDFKNLVVTGVYPRFQSGYFVEANTSPVIKAVPATFQSVFAGDYRQGVNLKLKNLYNFSKFHEPMQITGYDSSHNPIYAPYPRIIEAWLEYSHKACDKNTEYPELMSFQNYFALPESSMGVMAYNCSVGNPDFRVEVPTGLSNSNPGIFAPMDFANTWEFGSDGLPTLRIQ